MDKIDPGVSRKAQGGAAIIVGAALLFVLGLVGYILYKLTKPLGDAGEEVGKAVENVAGTVSETAGILRDSAESGRSTIAGQTGGRTVGQQQQVRAEEVLDTRLPLRMDVVSKKDKLLSNGIKARQKYNQVVLRVLTPSGAVVPGAEIQQDFNHKDTQRKLHGPLFWFTGADGTVSIEWTTNNVVGSDSEDDATFVARKTGYNPSNQVVAR